MTPQMWLLVSVFLGNLVAVVALWFAWDGRQLTRATMLIVNDVIDELGEADVELPVRQRLADARRARQEGKHGRS